MSLIRTPGGAVSGPILQMRDLRPKEMQERTESRTSIRARQSPLLFHCASPCVPPSCWGHPTPPTALGVPPLTPESWESEKLRTQSLRGVVGLAGRAGEAARGPRRQQGRLGMNPNATQSWLCTPAGL